MAPMNRGTTNGLDKYSPSMLCYRFSGLVFAVAVCFGAAEAQVVRLPAVRAVTAETGPYPGQLISHPGSAAQLLQAPGTPDLPDRPERPPDARPGMFQKLIFSGEWLPGGRGDDFGVSSLQLKTILALPIPSRDYPLIITPGFAVYYLDGPQGRDLPPRVYDAYTQFRWMRRLGPRWGIDLALTPGVFSDFQQSTGDAFRITGHGVAAWTATPLLKVVLGAAYIDRRTADVLPIAGVIWTPHDDAKYELVFPHPRIARRIYWAGAYTEEVQDWIYIAGELGGGTWAIALQSGANDMVDYTDYRVFVGAERKVIGGLDGRLEVGYVFGREIRFQSATPDLVPPGTVMVRGGVTY